MKKTIILLALLVGCQKELTTVATPTVSINSACYDTQTDSYIVSTTFSGVDTVHQSIKVAYYSSDCQGCDPDAKPVRVSTVSSTGLNGTFTFKLSTRTYGTRGTIKATISTNNKIIAGDTEAVSGLTCKL